MRSILRFLRIPIGISILTFLITNYLIRLKSKTNEHLDHFQNIIADESTAKCEYSELNPVEPNLHVLHEPEIAKALQNLKIEHSGNFRPKNCKPIQHVAILVPYRQREDQLKVFLLNMHPFLARQNIAYKIYVIESMNDVKFNRGLLFNVGFIESSKDSNNLWDCYVFHDVDHLPEDDHVRYKCRESPFHLAHFVSKRKYKPHYKGYIGGVAAMKKEQYELVNGYSNLYFGWGKEDDDHHRRILSKNMSVMHPETLESGKYFTFRHERIGENHNRQKIYKKILNITDTDGLNSVFYELKGTIKTPLYTKFIVNYDEDEYYKKYSFLELNISKTF